MKKRFTHVVMGGTFDRFHAGHARLLEEAFAVGEVVHIGLASDELASRLGKGHEVEPYSERLRGLRSFFAERGWAERAVVFPIHHPFGIAADDPKLEAIVVSEDTLGRAVEINEARGRRGLRPLEIVKVELALAEDGKPISSTRIRRGEIDRQGRVARGRR